VWFPPRTVLGGCEGGGCLVVLRVVSSREGWEQPAPLAAARAVLGARVRAVLAHVPLRQYRSSGLVLCLYINIASATRPEAEKHENRKSEIGRRDLPDQFATAGPGSPQCLRGTLAQTHGHIIAAREYLSL
jgi:hypothetical protein